jgi:hypothetical protein
MSDLLKDILQYTPTDITRFARDKNSNSGKFQTPNQCPSSSDTVTAVSAASAAAGTSRTSQTKASLLKNVILNERDEVQKLLRLAGKIGPVADTVKQKEEKYDAAFEAEDAAPISGYANTLQGFTLALFFFSYMVLAVIITIFVNMTSGTSTSAYAAGGTLIGFVVLGTVIIALLKRFA